MAESFREGDKVLWNSGGKTTETVAKKLTKATEVAGRHLAA